MSRSKVLLINFDSYAMGFRSFMSNLSWGTYRSRNIFRILCAFHLYCTKSAPGCWRASEALPSTSHRVKIVVTVHALGHVGEQGKGHR